MRIKIWGARGSIPTPIRPEDVREKIVSAILNLAHTEGEFREKLLSAILGEVQTERDDSRPTSTGRTTDTQTDRQKIVESYLDQLSPLAGTTASGNTPCIEVRSGQELFIIDAGSGIRELGTELMKGDCGQGHGVIHLFFSHAHWDHIQGFPFFRPAFIPGNKLFIYSVHDIEAALRRQQEFISFPVSLDYMQAEMEFIRLEPDEVLKFGDLQIRPWRNFHPGEAYSFRFEKGNKSFVYASDASYPVGTDLEPHIKFFEKADVLIFDSQFTQRESDEKEDWGHSSSFVGIELAQAANIKELVLYHYDPTFSDKDLEKILEDTEKFQENQYPTRDKIRVSIAHEGQIFNLMPAPLTRLEPVPGGKVIILKPAGIFDETVASELTTELEKLKDKESWSPQLVVDMSAVELLQVAGLRALVRLRKAQQSSPMVLAAPSLNVQQLIELAGYLDFFAIYSSVHAALKALKAHETLNLPGQIIKNRYSVTSKVGDGRLGTVFKATDTRQNMAVAIKILSPSFSEGAIEQFLNQARQIIDLDHPNIVQVFDCDQDRGLSYMVEEHIEGQTLRDLIDEMKGQPLPIDTAVSIAENIVHGLEYAHSYDVIHGDLKPKNVLIWHDQVKISDFGLGRLESGHKSLINIDMPPAIISARYVAPEQVLGHPIDARTDLYALGAILFELFTGHPLFESTEENVLQWQRNSPPPSPRQLNPKLSRPLEHLIVKLLDKDPNKRYAKTSQVRRILASIVAPGHSQFPRQARPAFVGNEPTLSQLADLWHKTTQGQGQVVFIKGASGLGKTRLAHELAQRVGPATLLVGQCHKLNEAPAYQPFTEAINTYFATTPVSVAGQQVGAVLEQLGQMLPEISHLFLEAKSPASMPSAEIFATEEPGSLIAEFISSPSLVSLIEQVSQQQPWLLILDDLHWADQNTLQLLAYLSRHCHHMRLMTVGIYQENEVVPDSPLAELLGHLAQLPSYTSLSLHPMTEAEIEQLLKSLWQQDVPHSLTTAIYRRSQGNPFFAEELAYGLVDDNVVSWRDNKWHFASVLESSLPRDLPRAILHRINHLSKETQTLLHQAAVLGRTFRFADLHEVSDLSEWDALESLDIALERHLLKQVAGEQVLHFKHAIVRDVFIKNLSHLKRRLMHRESGEALERRAQLGEPAGYLTVALAHHFYQAGEYRQALAYSREAGQQAEKVYAGHMALAWYTQALDALDQLNQDLKNDLERFDLLLAREKLYGYLGNVVDQADELLALQNSAQLLDDPSRQSIVHNRQAAYDQALGHYQEAKAEAHAALIMARQTVRPAFKGESLLQMAQVLAGQGDYAEALQQLDLAQEALDKTDTEWPERGTLLNLQGIIYFGLHNFGQARTCFEQAVVINRMGGNWPGQATSLAWLGRVQLGRQGYGQAKALCHRSLEMSRAINYRRGEALNLYHLGLIYQALGQDQLAHSFVEQALLLHRRLKNVRGEAEDFKLLGAIQRGTEDFAAAHHSLTQALELSQSLKIATLEAEISFELGLTYEEQTQMSEAQAAYEAAHRLQHTASNEAGQIEAQAGLARCLVAVNNLSGAEATIHEISTWLDEHGLNGINYPTQLYLTIYRVLRAANKNEAAQEAMRTCQKLIQQRAEAIEESEFPMPSLEQVGVKQKASSKVA